MSAAKIVAQLVGVDMVAKHCCMHDGEGTLVVAVVNIPAT